MLTTSATSNTLSAKIVGLFTAQPMRETSAVQTSAFAAAYARFAIAHPAWVDGVFDEHFLTHAGRDIVDDFVAGLLTPGQAAAALAKAWDSHLGAVPVAVSRRRIADATVMSTAFLQELAKGE
jgi:hypothetical protein